MILSIVGETDKRPFIYTLLKMCQALGDVLFVTNNRHYARLIEQEEDDIDVRAGYFQNSFIVVTDLTPDEARETVGYNPDDYEYIIYDHQIEATGDKIIYIAGMDMTEAESEMLEYMEEGIDYHIINFGFGKKKIPYTARMFLNCEIVESKRTLLAIDPKITQALARLLYKDFGLSVNNLVKVVNKR